MKIRVFPPEIAKCPDNWSPIFTEESGEGCKYDGLNPNQEESDQFPINTMVFESSGGFPMTDSRRDRKKKCEWAKDKGVLWDGIYYPGKECK